MQPLHSQEQVKVKSSKLAQKKQGPKPHHRRTALPINAAEAYSQPCCICLAAVLAALTAVVTAAGNALGNARFLALVRGEFSVKVSGAYAAVCARTNARHMLMVSLFKRKV